MSKFQPAVGQQGFIDKSALGELISVLRGQGYTVIGPKVCRGVVSLREIESPSDLAKGLKDEQDAGNYRLSDGDTDMFFQYVVGPDSIKRFLFPPHQNLFKMRVRDGMFDFESGLPDPPKLAMIGVRPCDLAAMQVQDQIFNSENRCETDSYYFRARRQMAIIAVNCTRPGGTCFCSSMDTGPQAKDGFDLALTELRGGFLVKVGTARGAQLAAALDIRQPSAAETELAELRMEQAREHMGRKLTTDGLRETLNQALEHPQWDEVAKRCMACGNCTMVCPTCFCSSVIDASDLTGGGVTRSRAWDCCYTHQFSYTTSGPVRTTIRSRYRQWLRHKLSAWWDQFDTSGCVGCGRCITWCPVGIDLTREAAIILGELSAPAHQHDKVNV